MKILILCIIFVTLNLYSLDLKKEIVLEKIDNYNFDHISSSDYNVQSKQLLLSVALKDITPNTQLKVDDKIFKGVFMFSDKGKFLGKIGKFNSYSKDGLISIGLIKDINNKINLQDYGKGELMIFSKSSFNHLYTIKAIDNPISGIPSFVYNDKVFFLQLGNYSYKRDKNSSILSVDKFEKVAIADLIDSEESEVKKISNIKLLYSTKDYIYDFWHDKRVLKNKVIKYYLKKWKNKQEQDVSFDMLYGMARIGPMWYKNNVTFDDKNNFYLANSYGTEIKKYNITSDLLNNYKINTFLGIRKKELDEYKNILSKKLKKKTEIKKFGRNYELSFLIKIFYDKNNNNIILEYVLRNIFTRIASLPKSKSYLLVYSLDKRKAVSDFIPINFTPIQFDHEKRELIGGQQRDGDIYLQFYKWEY